MSQRILTVVLAVAALSAPVGAGLPGPSEVEGSRPKQVVQTTPTPTPSPTPTPPAPPKQAFSDWIVALRSEALARGVTQATIDLALGTLEPDPAIIELDRKQPELTQTLEDYLKARVSQKNIDTGKAMIEKHAELLKKIDATYGVSTPLMVAVWAFESNFGAITGSRSTITALATLAYDGRRPALFRGELFQALAILDLGLITPAELKGSWAGAMGQPQFMPSSYLKFAIDFDGDGRVDIWRSEADVLASMANYLKAANWVEGESWGMEVDVSAEALAAIEKAVPKRTTGCRALKEMTEARALSVWADLGVKLLDGSALPATAARASLVRGTTRNFLALRNYHSLIDYNCSNSYALGVGLLADKIAGK